jgi:GNAT superfamily N-acetyltransferase
MGIAKKLLYNVETWAKANEAQIILVNAGNRVERKQAHLFYPQMGFDHKSSGYVKLLKDNLN